MIGLKLYIISSDLSIYTLVVIKLPGFVFWKLNKHEVQITVNFKDQKFDLKTLKYIGLNSFLWPIIVPSLATVRQRYSMILNR